MRVSKPPQERRAELVAAARALFNEKGVDKTRVSDIVRRVGVAQGVFYYYFSSKSEVVGLVLQQVAGEAQQALEAILRDEEADYGLRLAQFIELYIDLVDQFLGDGETSTRALHGGAEAGLVPREISDLLDEALEQLVSQGVALGQVGAAYPQQAAFVLVRGLLALARENLPSRPLIYALAEQALGLPKGRLLRYARQKPGPQPGKQSKAE